MMNQQWLYDPNKTFDDNFDNGPYISNQARHRQTKEPRFEFLGFPLNLPFGIAAGPLPTSKHVKAAFELGYDVVHYKTMRSVEFAPNPFPNVIPIAADGAITLEQAEHGVTMAEDFPDDVSKLVITNSFGNPSRGPGYWQSDMISAVEATGDNQLMIASVVGTIQDGFSEQDYWQDFANAAQMAQQAGAKVIEVNLSCPNVASEGVICYTPEAVVNICQLTKKAIGQTPLIIKLGYFSDEQQLVLENILAEVDQYIAAIAAINTIPAKVYDKNGKQALSGKGRLTSGLCGAGIKWAGLDMVERLAALRDENGYQYEIIGVGGVMTPDDFFAYREVGADVVQACTAPMWNPNIANEINELMKS